MNMHEVRREFRRLNQFDRFTPEQQRDYNRAESACVRHGWCPVCEMAKIRGDGDRSRLGDYQRPTADTYGGRECYQCEEFFPTGEQYDCRPEPELCCFSDADPGL